MDDNQSPLRRWTWLALLGSLIGLVLAGCGHLKVEVTYQSIMGLVKRGPNQAFELFPPAVPVAYPPELTLPVGEEQPLTVTVPGVRGAVTLVSMNEAVVRVGPNQTLIAVGAGTTYVVATGAGGSLLIPVTVVAGAGGQGPRLLGASAIRVDALGTQPLPLKVAGGGAVSWTSSDPAIATVDEQGRLVAHREGTVTITASVDGATTAPLSVLVKQRPYLVQATGPNGEGALSLRAGGKTTLVGKAEDPHGFAIPLEGFFADANAVAAIEPSGATTASAQGQTFGRAIAASIKSPDRHAVWLSVGDGGEPTAAAGTLGVFPPVFTLSVGNTQTLVVRAYDAEGKLVRASASFRAEPSGVVSVDAKGVVTALAPGRAVVTVRAGGATSRVVVTVTALEPAAGLRLTGPDDMRVSALGALPLPLAANVPGVSWESLNPEIATVDRDGLVTAIADGKATIVVRRGGESDAMTLSVDQRPAFLTVHTPLPGDPREIVTQSALSTFGVSATAFDFNGNAMAVEGFLVEDEAVAGVSEGVLTPGAQGSTFVRAISKGVRSDNANSLYVIHLPAEAAPIENPAVKKPQLVVTPSAITVAPGASTRISVVLVDADGARQTVPAVFTTDNPGVVTIGPDGTITGVGPGTANVTVSAGGLTKTVAITVVAGAGGVAPAPGGGGAPAAPPAAPATIDVAPLAITLNALGAHAVPLTVVVKDAGGNVLPVVPTFSSLTPAKVTVDAAGVLTAVADTAAGVPAIVRVTAGAVTADVQVTVEQRAATVQVNSALPGNPRTITFNNIVDGGGAPITVPLSVAALDGNGNAVPVTWTVSNPGVVTVNAGGTITLQGNGQAFVRVVTPGGVLSTDAQSIRVDVQATNDSSVDATINLP